MDIFEELGLHRYINAQDTFTTYGASCMPAASLRAMREIASSCVELAEVQAKTGDALAKLTHNEGAYISNGAAGGFWAAASTITGTPWRWATSTIVSSGREASRPKKMT